MSEEARDQPMPTNGALHEGRPPKEGDSDQASDPSGPSTSLTSTLAGRGQHLQITGACTEFRLQ